MDFGIDLVEGVVEGDLSGVLDHGVFGGLPADIVARFLMGDLCMPVQVDELAGGIGGPMGLCGTGFGDLLEVGHELGKVGQFAPKGVDFFPVDVDGDFFTDVDGLWIGGIDAQTRIEGAVSGGTAIEQEAACGCAL